MGVLLLLLAAAGSAGELRGRVAAEKAGDLSGIVVWVEGGEALPPVEAEASTQSMRQADKKFSPRVVAVRAGASVLFENQDKVFHNVFSLDKRNPFDLGLFKGSQRFDADFKPLEGGGEPVARFPEPGRYEVFCNIHPDMAGTVFVFAHGYFARTEPDGSFVLPHPGPGRAALAADGPRLKEPERLELELTGDDPPVEWTLELRRRAPTPPHQNKEGRPYPVKGY